MCPRWESWIPRLLTQCTICLVTWGPLPSEATLLPPRHSGPTSTAVYSFYKTKKSSALWQKLQLYICYVCCVIDIESFSQNVLNNPRAGPMCSRPHQLAPASVSNRWISSVTTSAMASGQFSGVSGLIIVCSTDIYWHSETGGVVVVTMSAV